MTKKRHLFVYCLLLLLKLDVNSQTPLSEWYSIKGFLPEWNGAIAELEINGKLVHRDTINKDIYSFTGKALETKEGLLKITKSKKTFFITLFIEPGIIKIRDDKQKLVAYGTITNDAYTHLAVQLDSLALLQKQLRLAEIRNYKRTLASTYIKEHPSSLISIKLLEEYFHLDNHTDDTLYYQLYHSLDSNLQQSYTGRKILPQMKQRYATATGRQAPLLNLSDSNKVYTPIYEVGQYTLINFWASWCLPCKREHPKLIEFFNHYKNQGFTIVSISLDTNRSAWLNGIKTEKLEWKQLSDLRGWKSPSATLYGVTLIPYNILLDRNGVIIGKNLNLDDIETILVKKAGFNRFIGPI